MKTLLRIHASLFGAEGQSSKLADAFTANWLKKNPDGRVILRDLAADPVPHLDAARFQALLAKPEERTPEQQAVADFSDALIAELKGADTIVFGVPMYNFSVPSTLRAYFDHIARAGVTFRYSASGPEGLIKDKDAYVFITRGGFYGADHTQTEYLRQFLAFIGISDATFVHAEGLNIDATTREKSLASAQHTIAELVKPLAAAAAAA